MKEVTQAARISGKTSYSGRKNLVQKLAQWSSSQPDNLNNGA